jgi:hypothetical protein
MIKEEEIMNPNSCLSKAVTGEPLFVLRANDELAPNIVRAWAVDYFRAKAVGGQLTKRQQGKYDEALELALWMERWKRGQS